MLSGAVLRDVRLQRGVSQAELARRVGISPAAISAYERERRHLSREVAARIIDALGDGLRITDRLDPHEQGRRLVEVLELAEALPYRPRPLAQARRS
jgi:transcriptional regulator with XRE-family HTH domain